MLKMRPITPSDISRARSVQISSVIKSDSDEVQKINNDPDVVSEAPYQVDRSEDNLFVEGKLYYGSTHIKLALPITNVFLAGIKLDVISKIVPDEYNVQDLAKGSAVLRIEKKEDGTEVATCIHPNKISNTDIYNQYKHLIGGAAVKYILEKLDIEESISRYLISQCNSQFSLAVRKELPNGNVGKIVEDGGDVWLIDKYFINLHSAELVQEMYNSSLKIRETLLAGKDSKGSFMPEITAMFAFRDDPKRFKDMMQDIIPILPYGFRPTIDKQKDPLSILYNRVVQANNELKNSILTTGCRLDVVRLKYANLYRKYLNLVYEKSRYDDDKFKPLLDILTGKSGVIRNNTQASTIDFAGRSVITVDPFMSVDTIGIPEDMAIHLCELDAVAEFQTSVKNKAQALEGRYKEALVKKAKAILDGQYIVVGRQPTLYILGMQAFKIKVVRGFSIVLNPVTTTAFNADFDGDQMYAQMPQSAKAKEEARKLMANVNNIFLPRDGSSHLTLRQEMIYGAYKCYHAKSDESSRTVTYEDSNVFRSKIIKDLTMQEVVIDDKCIVGSKTYKSVGYAALKIFLGNEHLQNTRLGVTPITDDSSKEEVCVTEAFFKDFFKHVKLKYSTGTFVNMVNRFVQLGFTVANLYAPDIGILKQVDTEDIKNEFEEKITKREEYYNLGFDTEQSYTLFYKSEFNKLEKRILDKVKDTLGPDNGFIQMIESGARGSKSNLLQLFGMKGTVQKDKVDHFNTLIRTSLADQLSGLEHFISAYGSRQGIIDKVIGTYAPGYLSRKMSHVTRHLSIVSEDCGSNTGISFTYDILCKMFGVSRLTGEPDVDYFTIKDYASKILESRFIVGGGISPLTAKEAESVFSNMIAKIEGSEVVSLGGVKLRSPLTCTDQCCVKCYGIDLVTNKMVIKGTPIGYIAGPSIGEPVTQLIMKNFQKGGVVGSKNLTSSFDALSDLLEMYSVSKGDSKDIPIVHDYIAPVEGTIRLMSRGDGTAVLNILDDGNKNRLREKVVVYEAIKFKEYVRVGDSIQIEEGMLDVNEILKYRGIYDAQMFMLFNAYNIFVNEVFVNFKHFEVLVNGMTLYLCTKGNSYFKTGRYYSIKEYSVKDVDGCEFIKVLRGLKQTPKIRNNFLTSIYLEDVNRTVTRNIVVSGEDDLTDPFVRISLGLKAGIGTAEPNYVDLRGV
jgi:DNA-directed RNA polymerase subunit beta'